MNLTNVCLLSLVDLISIELCADGGSNDMEATIEAANQAKAAGVTILVVGVGNWLNNHEIVSMVSEPADQNTFYATDFENLDAIKDDLTNSICNGNCTISNKSV